MSKTTVILLNAFPDKKIKSFGNKCLLKITNKVHVIDYHVQTFKKIFKDPQIIVVGGFDGKRLNKYISQNFKIKDNILYVEHEITHQNNIGTSLMTGLELCKERNLFLINSSILLKKKALRTINKTHSFVGTQNSVEGSVGYIKDKDYIINCYYGLPNEVLDMVYIHKNDIDKLYSIIEHNDIDRCYMFEILNLCIQNGIKIRPTNMPKGSTYTIDSCDKIKTLNRLNHKYV